MRPKLRRFLTFPPVGLTPTEHASLSWTHWFAKTSQRPTRPQPHAPSRLCWTMVARVIRIARLLIILASRHRSFAFENLALRPQLAVYQRTHPKPTVRWSDRLFWVGLRLAWPDGKSALVIVHRHGHRLASPRLRVVLDPTVASEGRPSAGRCRHATPDPRDGPSEPALGRAAYHGELLKLGFEVSERTRSARRTRSSASPERNSTAYVWRWPTSRGRTSLPRRTDRAGESPGARLWRWTAVLQLEVLALRHQLQVLQRSRPRRLRLRRSGPVALGLAVTYVERLANGARHRQARDGRRLASPGISACSGRGRVVGVRGDRRSARMSAR